MIETSQELIDFFGCQLVWLSSRSERNELYAENRGQGGPSRSGSGLPRLIGVQHEDDLIEVGPDQLGLTVGQLRAHKRSHVVMPGLMSFESVEEAFYEDERVVARLDGSVKIEQHMRFAETCGEAVFGLRLVDGATRVGDEFAVFVVDGNYNPPPKEPVAIVIANTEIPSCLRT